MILYMQSHLLASSINLMDLIENANTRFHTNIGHCATFCESVKHIVEALCGHLHTTDNRCDIANLRDLGNNF